MYTRNKDLSDQLRPIRRAIVAEYGLEWPVRKGFREDIECRSLVAWIASRKFGMGYEFVAAVCGAESVSTIGVDVRAVDKNPKLLNLAESLYEKYKGAV